MAETFTIKTMWNKVQRNIEITNSSLKFHVDNTDRTLVANALLNKDFHQSSKVKSAPKGADAYLHVKTNLYALKKAGVTSNQDSVGAPAAGADPEPVRISFQVLGVGKVKQGMHSF